jgi:seryl-tRNA synthetase
MDRIKSLKLKKLLKELDYVETDFELRNEIVGDADAEFIKSINLFLLDHPELKEIYDNKITENLDKSIKKSEEGKDEIEDSEGLIGEVDEIEIRERELTKELRKIYREIVKITHPDIVKVKKLNDLYIKATNFYDERNKIGLYQVCDDVGIKYELTEKDADIIEDNINAFKKKIVFLESTFTWKWYNTDDDSQKNKILLDYIKLRIS